MTISPTFYEQIFCSKEFCKVFLKLQLGFVIFWPNNIGAKAGGKMLAELTPSV
jgi:hypothetical protein